METVIVLATTLCLFGGLVLVLRRHERFLPRGSKTPEKDQRAESWLTEGSGRG